MTFSTENGIVDTPRPHSFEQTMERRRNVLQARGPTLFTWVDRSGEAEKARRVDTRIHNPGYDLQSRDGVARTGSIRWRSRSRILDSRKAFDP